MSIGGRSISDCWFRWPHVFDLLFEICRIAVLFTSLTGDATYRSETRGQFICLWLRVRVCKATPESARAIFVFVTGVGEAALESTTLSRSRCFLLCLLAKCSWFRQWGDGRFVLCLLAEPSSWR